MSFQAAIDKRDRDALVTLAVSQGKVIPLSAEQIAATPVATLKDVVDKTPVTVPLTAITPANVVQHSVDQAEKPISDMEKTIAARCGVDAAKLRSAKK